MEIPQSSRLLSDITWVKRCPYCGVTSPLLVRRWTSQDPIPRSDGLPLSRWQANSCSACGGVVLFKGQEGSSVANPSIVSVNPEPKTAHEDIPQPARAFLQQAYETLHAPDAAAVMAGSAVDGMLKARDLTEGSLYSRIDEALKQNILTQGMADWAHEVRLGSNRPRHADADKPHVSTSEAKQSVEFAEALGFFLFVLTARIDRGIDAAKAAE